MNQTPLETKSSLRNCLLENDKTLDLISRFDVSFEVEDKYYAWILELLG